MASGRVPNTVNTFTVTLLYLSFAVYCFFNFNDFMKPLTQRASSLFKIMMGDGETVLLRHQLTYRLLPTESS